MAGSQPTADRAATPRPEITGKPTPREAVVWGVLVAVMLVLVGLSVWRRAATPPAAPDVYATVPAFSLINRDGTTVENADLAGAPWVADFFFTRCVGICPRLTEQMQRLVHRLGERSPVRFVSISVDPAADTPSRLEAYASRFDPPPRWYFLTGEPAAVHDLIRKGFLLAVEANPEPDTNPSGEAVMHSNRFVLVDGQGRIRGYYDAFDEAAIAELVADVEILVDG